MMTAWLIFVSFSSLSIQVEPGSIPNENTAAIQDPPEVYTVISGQVFDALGRGVTQATVTISREGEPDSKTDVFTNNIGDFHAQFVGQQPGVFHLNITQPGFQSQSLDLEVVSDDWEPFVVIRLDGAMSLAGEVVDFLEAQPIINATVVFRSDYATRTCRTDEAGRFKFEGLLPGSVMLLARAEGFGTFNEQVEVSPESQFVTLELKPERLLHLIVVDTQDHPVEDVSIEMRVPGLADYRSFASDAQGKTTIDQLEYDVSEVHFRLTHRKYVSTGIFDRVVKLPQDTFETTEKLILHPSAEIVGTVQDAESKRKLNGGQIVLGSRLGDHMARAYTNLEGGYELTSIPAGKNVVTVHVAGYAPDLKEVELIANKTYRVDFSLDRGRTIRGSVTDAEDRPVVGAMIEALAWRGHRTLGLFARTNQEGAFVLEHAPTDAFTLNVFSPSHGGVYDQHVEPGTSEYAFVLSNRFDTEGVEDLEMCDAQIGDSLPPVVLTTLSDKRYDAQSLLGKWVLLDFWATWCGPCMGEIPSLKRIAEDLKDREKFLMLGISQDDDRAALENVVQSHKINWPQVSGEGSGAHELSEAWKVRAIPCTIVLDPQGRVCKIGLRGEALRDFLVKSVLGDEKPDKPGS